MWDGRGLDLALAFGRVLDERDDEWVAVPELEPPAWAAATVQVERQIILKTGVSLRDTLR